ncbi:hypothetical protein HC251_06700 [Iamia sp. SCSIO 61187]|uniref:hypothetical protein n=1 Tax=Iamia sp. SCSIO 61187 TaxID=2722752 RepID=UPI001C631175|nr:hypothetical protein [Iamia sp. SCSIO 61187]QYG92159.1 hypothetical protein HC251_06700 [Iamia sp. SCSIO 61187]
MADWPSSPPVADRAEPSPGGGTGLQVGGARYPDRPPEHWPAYAPPPASAWGVPAGPPPPGPDGGGPRPWPVAAAVLAIVVVLGLVIVGVGAVVSSSDDAQDEATDTTIDLSDPEITAPPSEEPIQPTLPNMPSLPELTPGGPDPAEQARPLAEVLPEIIDFVEETRGQEFRTDPVVQAVPDDEFVGLLEDAQAEEADALVAAGVTDAALGLIPPGTDLAAIAAEAGAVSVLGFYDPETDELYVKGDVITPFVQTVIAHELTHALDDQVFDLGRLDAMVEAGDESAFGFLALVEGTASFVGDAYRAQLSPEDAAAADAEELALGFDQLPSLIDIPPAYLVESLVPYASGQRFVEALLDAGGTTAVDAAYMDPPTTSEQVLDPAVYEAGEEAVDLNDLVAPGEVVDEGTFGAADLRLLEVVSDPMSALVDPDVGLLEPFEGFGGGQYVSWTEGGESCVLLEAVGDDAAGSAAIADALDAWAAAAPGASVGSRVGGNGLDVITATRCA